MKLDKMKLPPLFDIEVNLLLSPPQIKERSIELHTQADPFYFTNNYTPTEEGRLNISVSQSGKLKYHISVFGKIKGKELRFEREVKGSITSSSGIQNMRIKYILFTSRNILRTYYLNSNLKSIENHLMSFLIPV
ncbi:MAG: hypothetical protein ABIP51_19440 [Bacteroidia bacterium]